VSTFDDLEREVQKLRQTVRRLEGGNATADNTRVVEEPFSTADGDERLIVSGGGGGFAAPCAESSAALCKESDSTGSVNSGGSMKKSKIHDKFGVGGETNIPLGAGGGGIPSREMSDGVQH
jgi:hypothetical protein